MQPFIQRKKVFLLHLSFWFVYVSFLLYQISYRQKERDQFDLEQAIWFALLNLTFSVTISYLNYFYFLPRFLRDRRIWRYLLEFVLPFAALITLRVQIQRYIVDGYTHQEWYFYSSLYIVQTTVITLFIVIFIGMLHFAVDWFEFEARQREVENQKLTAELNFLKAQINPHFLFNTLNNLYYLVFTKSDAATEVIAKLSQMMRYMIYDSNHPKVPLTREIEYMQNYIDLEKLRLNNEVPIRFEVHGNVKDVMITPLVLITFLENAFKHGVSNDKPGTWITIRIDIENGQCTYTVENSKLPTAQVKNANGKSGIGLQNVKRRLELSYPDHYLLHTENLNDRYKVQLKISLA